MDYTSKRKFVARAFLWFFVIALSLQIGAGLYELRVVTPLWARSAPESVRGWNSDPRYAIEPREKFWRYCTPAVGLTALCALVSSWLANGAGRRWLTASAVIVIILVLATYVYFAPALAELLEGRGAGLSDEEIRRRVGWWLWLGQARAVAYVVAWLAALKAFGRPVVH